MKVRPGQEQKGKKMSKSKGNVVMPEEMIEKYNVDSVRCWAASVKLGDDLPFKEKDIKTGNIILTKLWNSARFIEMNVTKDGNKINISNISDVPELRVIDRWVLTRLSDVISHYHKYFKKYQITKAKKVLVHFFKHEFCDYYLELIKYRFYGSDEKSRYAAQWTSYHVLLGVLKLFSPFMPFITEEIYQSLFRDNGILSIHVSSFPEAVLEDKEAEKTGEFAVSIISAIRKYKTDMGVSMNSEVACVNVYTDRNIDSVTDDISGVMKIKKLEVKSGKPELVEKIVRITPDFGKIGPEFGKDTNKVAALLKTPEIAQELERAGSLEAGGFLLKKEYLFKIERESVSESSGMKVAIVEDKDFILEITR